MPAPARHQLAILLLCDDVDQLVDHMRGRGQLDGDGPGTVQVAGGFLRARVMRFDAEQFVSSGQGGFRVRCPAGAGNVTRGFVPALEAWRAGGARELACRCGVTHDLAELEYAPACGFSREWLELVDVGEATPPAGLPRGVRVVLRRG